MKEQFLSFWQDIKDDPFGFIIGTFTILLFIFAMFVLFYSLCTGHITSKGGKGTHGMRPMYIGKRLIFIPY